EPLASILGSMKAVAEGVPTTRSVAELARRHGVEMPITFVVERMLYEGLPPGQGVRELLSRDLKHEMAD
ncbi:MAG: glycerol-3-phosphate dehydrogenase, partial [Acidobacteriota bacterium]